MSVVRFLGNNEAESYSRLRLALSACCVDKLLVPNLRLKDALARKTKLKIHKIVLGLDTCKFGRKDSVSHRAVSRPSLLIFGRLDPVKGHLKFIELFAHMFHSWVNKLGIEKPVLHIVGEEANLTRVEIVAALSRYNLALDKDVFLHTERIKDVPALMSSMSVGVVSSLGSEQIGRVSEEFLLCGTPIFVSDVGGLLELLYKDSGLSYQVDENKNDLSKRLRAFVIKSYLEDLSHREVRAAKAVELYSLDAMGTALKALL